jgi:hypothetical protein
MKVALCFLMVISFSLHASDVPFTEVSKIKDGTYSLINFPESSLELSLPIEGAYGSAYKVVVNNNKEYLLDTETMPDELLEKFKSVHSKKPQSKLYFSKVNGIFVKEKGHFPNPMAEFEVFKYVMEDASAQIFLCPELAYGCVDKVSIKGKEFTLDKSTLSDRTRLEIQSLKENNPDGTTKTIFLRGFTQSEDGHMPNPTVFQKVFKPMNLLFADDEVTGSFVEKNVSDKDRSERKESEIEIGSIIETTNSYNK